jgi:hypothetical protein
MSWHPNDLLTDADLLAYEPTILTQFGRVEWIDKRAKALEDWLWPSLQTRGLDPERLRTRVQPAQVWSFQSSTFTDCTEAAISQTTDDVAIGSWLTNTTDALFIGSASMFRGLSLRVADLPSSAASALTIDVWQDAWTPIAVTDGTQATAEQSFSRGGAITWRPPAGWVVRSVNNAGPRYWVRLRVSAAVTSGARAGQLSVIRRSVFGAPVTYKTLEWIFRAAPTSQDGPWRDKAEFYADAAEVALQRALQAGGGEFDTVTEDDVIDVDEAAQTTEEAGGATAWTLERG